MIFYHLFLLAAALVSVSARVIVVNIGENGGLTFNPSSVNAQNGDEIHFHFLSKNHTVTQSTFDNPCAPLGGGVDSGYQAVVAEETVPTWTMTVNDATSPLWFFCAQGGHCQRGMVFAVNPTQDRTFEAFQALAMMTSAGTDTNPGAPGIAGSLADDNSASRPQLGLAWISRLGVGVGCLLLGAVLL